MIHELRSYRCMPGRLTDVIARFEQTTLRLFERHGIRATQLWTVAVGPSSRDLVYVLEWSSLAARERQWAAFQQDPEWLAARTSSEVDGPIVESVSNLVLEPVLTERWATASEPDRGRADLEESSC
jgi:hypothetical protein